MAKPAFTVDVRARGKKGVDVTISHEATDSLAVVYLTYTREALVMRSGLRGNYDAAKRPIRWMSQEMISPLVSAASLAARKAAYTRRLVFAKKGRAKKK